MEPTPRIALRYFWQNSKSVDFLRFRRADGRAIVQRCAVISIVSSQ